MASISKKRPQEATNQIIQHLMDDKYCPGERLPSYKALMLNFNCSMYSVRRAMLRLEQLGRIKKWAGKGVFVAEETQKLDIRHIFSLTVGLDEAETNFSVVENLKYTSVSTEVRSTMGISHNKKLIEIEVLNYRKNKPYILTKVLSRPEHITKIRKNNFKDLANVYKLITAEVGERQVSRADLISRLPTPSEVTKLCISKSIPVVVITGHHTHSHNNYNFVSVNTIRSDNVEIRIV